MNGCKQILDDASGGVEVFTRLQGSRFKRNNLGVYLKRDDQKRFSLPIPKP